MGEAEIIIKSPLSSPERRELADEAVSIGRGSDCEVPVRDRFLSRKHAEIRPEGDEWLLVDCRSVNGTWINGVAVTQPVTLKSGDRIRAGQTEISFYLNRETERITAIQDHHTTASISMSMSSAVDTPKPLEEMVSRESVERLLTLNTLAGELLGETVDDEEIFEFILQTVLRHTNASRAAIALLDDEGEVEQSRLVRKDPEDDQEFRISSTLLSEVVSKRQAVAYLDADGERTLRKDSVSITDPAVRSVLCAPVMMEGEVGAVLYVDHLATQQTINEEDVRLVAQIASFVGLKLETASLREKALRMRLLDEELRTAHLVQQGLLPDRFPDVDGFTFFGSQRPARSVGGDYYDVIRLDDGTVYFIIADVSGKGITAALLVAGLQASFRILARANPAPDELVSQLNASLLESTPQSGFVTMIAGRLDPGSGRIDYTNAGHVLPVVLGDGVEERGETDIVVGAFQSAKYRTQHLELEEGESIVLFTDGLLELEDEEASSIDLFLRLESDFQATADDIGASVEDLIAESVDGGGLVDDVTLLIITCRKEARESV